jgi:FkbM family methyltransferase
MKDLVFTSYGFGDLYCRQQERLEKSIRELYPEASIRFWHSINGSSNNDINERPPGSKTFHESMYGFKVHCIKSCLDEGFKRIIFLDVAVVLESGLEIVLETLRKEGVMCAIDPSLLIDRVSDKCLQYMGKTKEDIKDLTIVGGSVYLFDFNHPITQPFFDEWYEMENLGLFGSESDAQQSWWNGHRCDEACFSLCLDKFGLKPSVWDHVGYFNAGTTDRAGWEVFVFHKLHFKAFGKIQDHTINESLLPIGANILDLGCRDFNFTNTLRELEHNVYPVDIDDFDGDYYKIAISDKDGKCGVVRENDPNATHIKNGDEIPMMTLETFSKHVGVDHWDLIKMDIEGEEINILNSAKHPIASQISVEFHAHCTNQTKEQIDECLNYLSQWYHIHNQVWDTVNGDPNQGMGKNYWDVLLIKKNIINKILRDYYDYTGNF